MFVMKFLVTGDNHVDFLRGAESVAAVFSKRVASYGVDFTINLGDMTNGRLWGTYRGLDKLLGSDRDLYVLGNHDLWSPHARSGRTIDKSFLNAIGRLKDFPAVSLENSIDDTDTIWTDDAIGCSVVGTIGLPDFAHPRFVMPPEYYDKKHCTNDGTYIDMSKGWLIYTKRVIWAFNKRLSKALQSPSKEIVIGTHYPIFDGQYRLSGDDISAYFFCYKIGQMVLEAAKKNPDKRFWCMAAHAHDYNRGELVEEATNVASYGLVADYGWLALAVFDTDLGFSQVPIFEWCPEKCKLDIRTVESR